MQTLRGSVGFACGEALIYRYRCRSQLVAVRKKCRALKYAQDRIQLPKRQRDLSALMGIGRDP